VAFEPQDANAPARHTVIAACIGSSLDSLLHTSTLDGRLFLSLQKQVLHSGIAVTQAAFRAAPEAVVLLRMSLLETDNDSARYMLEVREITDSIPIEEYNRLLEYVSALTETNHRLEQLALTDPLTEIGNRRAFEERLHEELARSLRYGRPISLLMLDVDEFKGINDRFGHAGGDAFLRDISDVLRGAIRQTDFAARIGGDEFAVILPDTGAAGALQAAERIRLRIESSITNPCRGSVSIGALAADDPAISAASFISSADALLYHAKRSGQNCIAVLLSDGTVTSLRGDCPIIY